MFDTGKAEEGVEEDNDCDDDSLDVGEESRGDEREGEAGAAVVVDSEVDLRSSALGARVAERPSYEG